MEELAIGSVVFLVNHHTISKVLVFMNYVFEAAFAHVCLETIFNILFCISFEVHEHRAVQVNHGRCSSSCVICLLEALN